MRQLSSPLSLRCLASALLVGGLLSVSPVVLQAKPPAVGDDAADFTLKTVEDEEVSLAKLTKSGPVVLIVLRGYPGYQCPACNSQTGQFIGAAQKFAEQKANIVLVYPGAATDLKKHAGDFSRGKTFPDNCYLVLDPDYSFTNAYGLRWLAKNETAYPSTFLINPAGKITFAKISKSHGVRTSVEEVLKAMPRQ